MYKLSVRWVYETRHECNAQLTFRSSIDTMKSFFTPSNSLILYVRHLTVSAAHFPLSIVPNYPLKHVKYQHQFYVFICHVRISCQFVLVFGLFMFCRSYNQRCFEGSLLWLCVALRGVISGSHPSSIDRPRRLYLGSQHGEIPQFTDNEHAHQFDFERTEKIHA